MRHTYAKITCRILLVSFLALMLIACGQKGNPGGTSGPGVTAAITLGADAVSLPADGLTSTTIRANLVDSTSNPVYQRTSIVFTTNLGKFRNGSNRYEVSTQDDTGSVIVQLISDTTSGTAEVWAESNKVKQKIEVKFYDPNKSHTITVRSGALSVTADGSSKVAVIATVVDARGALEEGATVTFTTSIGRFVEASPLPGMSDKQATAITDVDGEAKVMLVSGTTIGKANIIASIDGLSDTVSIPFTAGEPTTITVRAAPSTIKPRGASSVYAALTDINGNPVEGRTVVFTPLVNVSEGSLSTVSSSTDVNGEALTNYTAGKNAGQNIIQAALSDNLSLKSTIGVLVDPGAIVVSSITATAGAAQLVADGISSVKIRATVKDIDGNEAIGKTVHFTTTAGFLTPASAATSDLGVAESMLRSTTISGPVKVRAECDGFIADVTVEFVPGPPDHILLYALPNVVPPNGAFRTSAAIMDKYDNRISDQRLIFLVRKVGNPTVVNSLEMTPDQATDGVYNHDWTATYEIYGLNDIEITARINNNVSQSAIVHITEGAIIVGSISVTAGAKAIPADGTSKVAIRATVLDDAGKPAQGITVNFSTTLGTLDPVQKKTDENGYAQVMLTAGTIWGTAAVNAEANGFWGQTQVLFTTGTAAGLFLKAMPDVVEPGGQSTIIAELHNSAGEPVANEVLNFDLYTNNSMGSLSPIQATTDTNGRATVTYTGGTVLTSCCNGDGDHIRVTLVSNSAIRATTCVSVAVPTKIVGSITLTSADNSLPVCTTTGGCKSTALTATVLDTAGFPMPKGTSITFSTTLGTFPGGTDPQGPITSELTLSTTDDTGRIITSLIAGNKGGVAEVKAICGGVMQVLNIFINDGSFNVGSIVMSANPTSIPADGASSSAITATVKDISNNPVPLGTPVIFTTNLGTFSNGLASIVVNTPNASGTVITSLIAGTTVGSATITATCGGLSQNTTVDFTSSVHVVGSITLTSNKSSIPADGVSSAAITATIFDTNNTPMPKGTSVTFETTLGTFANGLDSITLSTANASGAVTTSLIAGLMGGTAIVTATSGGITQMLHIVIDDGTVSVGSITLSANPAKIPADGASSSAITATVLNTANNPVPVGTPVVFTTTLGTFINGFQSITVNTASAAGTATTSLIAGLDSGEAWVTATAGSMSQLIKVTFEEGTTKTAEMVIDVSKRVIDATGSATSDIKVLLRDADHNPIKDATINFSTNLGTVTGTGITGADGYAYIQGTTNFPVLTSAKQNGVATVKAWYGPKSSPYATAQTDVEFAGVTITVTADPDSLSTSDTSVIKATLKGPSGDPMVDQEVLLETNLGKFTVISTGTVTADTSFSGHTDSKGQVTVRLSSTSAGTALVTGWHAPTKGKPGETSDTKEVRFTGYKLTITPSADYLVANGSSSMPVVLKLEDQFGVAVASQEISLSTSLGHIDSSVITGVLGEATATLTSGTVIGVAKLTAMAELPDGTGITVTAEVSFISGPVASVTLVADPSIIQINTGVAELRAMVRDSSGNPVQGVNVAFTLIHGPGGGEAITPVTVRTGTLQSGVPGRATASFKAGSLGSTSINDVIIEASVGAVTASASLTISSGVGHIALGACTVKECVTNNMDGTFTIPVAAVLSDVNGIAVPAGVAVSFSVGNPELGTIVSPVSTDAQGRAATTLTYPATKAGNNVELIASASGIQESVTVKLPYLDTESLADIILNSPASILGDGVSTAQVIAQAVNSSGQLVSVSVDFENNVASDFSGAAAGSFSDYIAYVTGQTNVKFIADPSHDVDGDPSNGFVSQNYNGYLRAYSGTTIKSKTNTILIKGITLTVEPENTTLLANGISTTTLTAILKETATGLPIVGKNLNFGVTNGFISGADALGNFPTDSSGVVRATFTSIKSNVNKTASIRCYYGSDIMASTQINLITSAAVGAIFASSDKTTLHNNPSETATITAQVLDAQGNPVPDGQTVTFDIISGPGQVDASSLTGSDGRPGITTATFTATPTTGKARIRVASGGLETVVEINIIENEVGSITVTSGSGSIIADGSSKTAILATVKDTAGNPMSGYTVTFATTKGSLDFTTADTNASGVAQVMLTSATSTGTATVTATADGFTDTVDVAFVAGSPANLVLMAAPSTVNPGGGTCGTGCCSNTSTLTATLVDANNNPVQGQAISFNLRLPSTVGATLSAVSAVTDINGQAKVTYTAGNTTGTDRVTARSVTNTAITDYVDITVDNSAAVVGSITAASGASSLVANGTSTAAIRATVKDTCGNVMPGVTVNFALMPTALGTLSGASAVTNSSGVAQVTFNAGTTTGTATITATISGFTAGVNIALVAGSAAHLALAAAPSTVNPGGASCASGCCSNTSTLTATVTDAGGNAVSGDTVAFLISTNHSGASLSAVSAVTNINGQATVTYTAGSTVGTDTITAHSVSNAAASNSTTITVNTSASVVGSISVISGASSIVASTTSTTAIRATVKDTCGNLMAGVTVNFATTLGLIPVSAVTNSSGIATVTLTAVNTAGTAIVTAEASGFIASVNVMFVAGAPNTLVLRAAPSTVNPGGGTCGTGCCGSTSTLTATLTDSNGNPISGETISFALSPAGGTAGASISAVSAVTNINGQASITYTAGTTAGTDTVTAKSTTKTTVSDFVVITVDTSTRVVGSISVISGASSIVASTTSTTAIRATVKDACGNLMTGVTVNFATTLGLIPVSAVTNSSGIATVTLTAVNTAGTAMVTAEASGFIASVNVAFVAGAPNSLDLTSAPSTVHPRGTSTVTATLKDAHNNPISGETINFSIDTNASGASISSTSGPTNNLGEATIIYTAGATQPATDVIRARSTTDTSLTHTASITVNASATVVGSITVTSSPSSIVADGSSTATIRATVRDTDGNLAPGISVSFGTTLGWFNAGHTLISTSATTNTSGVAQVTLYAGTTMGTAAVTGTASGFADSVDVAFINGAPAHLILTAVPSSVNTGATSILTATLTDNNVPPHPVAGETINFGFIGATDNKSGASLSLLSKQTDVNGQAAITYTAGTVSSVTDKVTARCASNTSVTDYVNIDVTGGSTTVAAIGLVAEHDSIIPGTSIFVTAMVYDSSGHGLGGQNVTFALDDPTLGFITSSGTTATDGSLVVTFTARSNIGTVNITATSGSKSSAPKAITIMNQLVSNISLSANPTSIIVTKTSTITAYVTDSLSNPVANGTTVYFTLTNSAYGTITESSTTNAGYAVATFTADSVPGTATIAVSSGTASNSIDITIEPAEAASIEFESVSKNPVAIRGTGGQEFSIIKFRVMDINGNPANDIDVLFTMVSGIHGSEYLDVNDATPYVQVVGTLNGEAQVTLHSGSEAGTVTIVASITTASSTTISATTPVISIGGGVPTDRWFTVSCDEPGWNLGGLNCVGQKATLTAWLADRFGNYNVLDGTTVSFQSEVGLAVNPIGVTDGALGTATAVVRTQGGSPMDVLPETWEENLQTHLATDFGPGIGDTLPDGWPRLGVCNVLVFVMGEETFLDGSNGHDVNGLYDFGETFTDTIDDPWRDYDDDGLWDNGLQTTPRTTALIEPLTGIIHNPMEDAYQDRAGNSVWNGLNTIWDGPGGVIGPKNIYRQVDFLITGAPLIRYNKTTFNVPDLGSDTIRIIICDENYNPLSAGSTFTVSVDKGKITGGTTSYTYPSSSFFGGQSSINTDAAREAAQRGLIENVITISDADPTKALAQPAMLTVTVTQKTNGACGELTRSISITGTTHDGG